MVKKGFTLIELLVVIAIIAILAAILFPVFARAREKARQTSCLSNIKQLTLGVQMYVQDFDERFPPLLCTDGATYLYTVFQTVQPYIKPTDWPMPEQGYLLQVSQWTTDKRQRSLS